MGGGGRRLVAPSALRCTARKTPPPWGRGSWGSMCLLGRTFEIAQVTSHGERVGVAVVGRGLKVEKGGDGVVVDAHYGERAVVGGVGGSVFAVERDGGRGLLLADGGGDGVLIDGEVAGHFQHEYGVRAGQFDGEFAAVLFISKMGAAGRRVSDGAVEFEVVAGVSDVVGGYGSRPVRWIVGVVAGDDCGEGDEGDERDEVVHGIWVVMGSAKRLPIARSLSSPEVRR